MAWQNSQTRAIEPVARLDRLPIPYGGEFQRTICTADSAREISEGLGAATQRFLPPIEISGA